MAILFVPTIRGGRTAKAVVAGTTIAQALRILNCATAGARFGVERLEGTVWKQVSSSTVISVTDELRVRMPLQQSNAGTAFGAIMTALLPQLKLKRKKAPR